MAILYVDLVAGNTSSTICAIAASAKPEPYSATDTPPDPANASPGWVVDFLDMHSHTCGLLSVWKRSFDPAEVPLSECVRDCLDWCCMQHLYEDIVIDEIIVSSRSGVTRTRDARSVLMPGRNEIATMVHRTIKILREYALAPGIVQDKQTVVPIPPVRVVPYGIPGTPLGLIIARHCAVSNQEAVGPLRSKIHVEELPGSGDMDEIRSIPALLFSEPPALLQIARIHTRLMRSADNGRTQTARLVDTLVNSCCERIIADTGTHAADAAARELAAQIRAVVDGRQGDYEACEYIMRKLWDSTNDAPAFIETACGSDPWFVANALFCRAVVANHRGDWQRAEQAVARLLAAAEQENSLRISLLCLQAANIAAVASQNRWPFDPDDNTAQPAMAHAYEMITMALRKFTTMFAETTRGDVPVRDPVYGAALGTLGRTLAFLGRHDEAAAKLETAASHFLSPLDLAMNASFRIHVEIDRDDGTAVEKISPLLDMVTAGHGYQPANWSALLHRNAPGCRFTIDLILKVLTAHDAVGDLSALSWIDALRSKTGESLFNGMKKYPTHPGELICRHAGELLARHGCADDALRWYNLGIFIAQSGGETMQRIGYFTCWLANGNRERTDTPRGSIFNPCYEYR